MGIYMVRFQLTNPILEGSIDQIIDAKTPIEAAEKSWINLSQYIVSSVPKFLFTMKNTQDGGFYHFEVNENKAKNQYNIKSFDIDISKQIFSDFIEKVNKNRLNNDEKQ